MSDHAHTFDGLVPTAAAVRSAIELDAAALGRAAAVVRNRRHVADRGDREANGLQRAQRRLAARTRAGNFTSSVRMPCSCALRPASSAAICAAYGVDLREPLKPIVPADDQEIVLPCASVMVIDGVVEGGVHMRHAHHDVLLFFLARARAFASALLVISHLTSYFLLAGDRLGGTFAGAGVGVGALAADRQALAVTQAAIAAQVHQALDVHRHFTAQVALDQEVAVDDFADLPLPSTVGRDLLSQGAAGPPNLGTKSPCP
jgi:hypothetical protein